jgi:hypothetical protein
MNVHPRILVPAAGVLVAAAAVAGVLAAHSPGNSGAASSNRTVPVAVVGMAVHPPLQCGQGETAMGYVGVDQSSATAGARETSGRAC